jgi:uncharacterized protein (UPF0333 family)
MSLTISFIATAFSLVVGIITLFWKLSKVVFQVEQNTKDIFITTSKMNDELVAKQTIMDIKQHQEEADSIVNNIQNRLSSIETKLDLLISERHNGLS